ncbi:MAG: hypothetical protein P1P84_23605 [Deferrisomatales bacterium]|nr:hypothetical protein [Deferrisomatales bacterium]
MTCRRVALGLIPLLALLAGCAGPRLAYYPAVTPEPLAREDGRPLTGRVVRPGAEVLAAPRAGADRLSTLAFGDRLLLYAFQPAREQPGGPRFALVGAIATPGTVSGWVPAEDLLPADTLPTSRLVVRASTETRLRTGPGAEFPEAGSVEHWFIAASYARRGDFLLVGPLQATRGTLETPEVGGWLHTAAGVPWEGSFGARFFTENFTQRQPAQIVGESEGEVLYAEPASTAPLPPGANRFPVRGWPADPTYPLRVALPGGALGRVAEFDADGRRQVQVERLLSRAQVAGARSLFRRVTDRARGEPRALAAAVEAATGSPTTTLADHCAATLGFPLRAPVLGLPAEALAAACLGDPAGCAAALAALGRSADALDSVAEEVAVTVLDGAVVPVREHSWSKGPRPLPYWWRAGDGRELAWVPVEFLP